MNMESILIVKKFITAFIDKQNQLNANIINLEQPILKSMFQGILNIEKERQLFVKENAPNFNIFSIIRYGNYETRLHTPLLVQLLTPNAEHQIGLQLLKPLIDNIFDKIFIESEIKNIEVFEECTDGYLDGRIDIFIQFLYEDEYYYIAIENKINADDQENQLKRYYDFLIFQSQKLENIRLVYLTKYGSPPKIPYSISQTDYNNLTNVGVLKLLSYKSNIKSWINIILNNKIPNSVKEILRQYLNTINRF